MFNLWKCFCLEYFSVCISLLFASSNFEYKVLNEMYKLVEEHEMYSRQHSEVWM